MPAELQSWVAKKVRADRRLKILSPRTHQESQAPQLRFRATSYTFAKTKPAPSASLSGSEKLAIGAQQVIVGRLLSRDDDHYAVADVHVQDTPLAGPRWYLYKDHWAIETA